jgi:outer membrane protein TolC
MTLNFIRIVISFLIIAIPLLVWAEETSVSLSLDDAMRLALKQNINLQSARDRVTSANIALESAKSEFRIKIRPEVSGLLQEGGDLNQNYALRVSKKLHIGSELSWQAKTWIDDSLENQYQTDLTIAYTQSLLRGRGKLPTTEELVSAEQRTVSQYRSLFLAQQQLMVNVATAYYGILRDQMLVEVNERALERAKTLLQAAEAKLKVGMASKMDVFRAELQVLTGENGLVDARESLENTKRRFNLILGADLGTEFVLSTTLEYTPISIDQEQLVQQALENRLEILEAYEGLNDAERRMKIARQNLYPPLDLSVQYTLSGEGNAFEESLDLKESRWGIGINSSFNLDFARDRAAYQQAQLTYNGAIRSVQSVEQDVLLDVLQTVTSVKQAQARVYLQEQSVFQAEKQLELAELRYKKGLSDNLDVIDAEESFIKAKTSYYSAVVQHLIAKMRLKQVTGTLEVPF